MMRIHFWWLLAGSVLALTSFSGCHCCCRRPRPAPAPAPVPVAPCVSPAPCIPVAPMRGPAPAPIMVAPAQPAPPPPAPVPVEEVRPYSPPPPDAQQGSHYWHPAEDHGVRLAPPVPDPDNPSPREEAPLPPMPRVPDRPQVAEEREKPPAAAEREQSEVRPERQPRVAEARDTSPALPVGIPQFALAWEKVASGLRPSMEGLDWLKEHGYHTVLHLKAPGEDDTADRKQVSKRGLAYLSLQVSPRTLTKAVVDDFSRIVTDARGYPLFIYDADGMVAGGLWYLYFRTVEKDTDEAARVKAARLGLSEDAQGEHKTMWLAIQNYLSLNKP